MNTTFIRGEETKHWGGFQDEQRAYNATLNSLNKDFFRQKPRWAQGIGIVGTVIFGVIVVGLWFVV